jgi:hypothetical protein
MSKGLGFLQSNIQDMLQDGDTLTVADVMEVAGPDYDPRHIRRAFKSLHRRGKVELPPKRWTPLLSSFWSRKVFYGYGTSSIYG